MAGEASGGLRAQPDGVSLQVRVQPRSPRTEIVGWRAGSLIVRLTTPALEGRANEALRALLAKTLGIPAHRVTLRTGGKRRDKVEFVAVGTAADLKILGHP